MVRKGRCADAQRAEPRRGRGQSDAQRAEPGRATGRTRTRNGQNPGVAEGKADAQRASKVSPHFIKSGHGRGDENAN